MWKRSAGNWHERLHRDTDAPEVSVSPSVPPPARLHFLDSGFRDSAPLVAFPTAREAATAGTATATLSPSTWVSFSGVDGSNALQLREYLDASVGRAVAHFVPRRGEGRLVYIKFDRPADAHWAVHRGRFQMTWDSGVADGVVQRHFLAEVDPAWCLDKGFLEADDTGAPASFASAEDGAAAALPAVLDAAPSSGSLYQGDSMPVLGLFFTPCDNVFYQLVRLAFLLLWCLWRTVEISLWRHDTEQINGWRSHGRQLDSDSLCTTPVQFLTYFISFWVPFAPPVAQVDLHLWSWWSQRSAYPQLALQKLKGSLTVPRSATPTDPAQHVLPVAGRLPITRRSALLTWRASWPWMRYSYLSGAIYVALVLWALWL